MYTNECRGCGDGVERATDKQSVEDADKQSVEDVVYCICRSLPNPTDALAVTVGGVGVLLLKEEVFSEVLKKLE